MNTDQKNYFRFTLGLFFCLFVRLIPFRAPNVEPILATTMPFGKYFGRVAGFSFGILSILIYDLSTATLGAQTFFTASAYGLIGLASAVYFSKKIEISSMDYVKFAIVATLFFDAVTGLTVGPLLFHQPFMSALAGQLPFTALHLLGDITLAYVLSPAIYKILYKKRKREIASESHIKILNPKII